MEQGNDVKSQRSENNSRKIESRAGRSDCNLFLVQQLLAAEIWTEKENIEGKKGRSCRIPKEEHSQQQRTNNEIFNNKYVENVIFLLRRFDAQFLHAPAYDCWVFSPCVSRTDCSKCAERPEIASPLLKIRRCARCVGLLQVAVVVGVVLWTRSFVDYNVYFSSYNFPFESQSVHLFGVLLQFCVRLNTETQVATGELLYLHFLAARKNRFEKWKKWTLANPIDLIMVLI